MVTCNVCGWTGPAFREYRGRPDAQCPYCKCLERQHEVMARAIEWKLLPPVEQLLKVKEPGTERCLFVGVDVLTRSFGKIYRLDIADIARGIDVTKLPYPDNIFDLVVHIHVLEHVADDAKATREIFRVLKPGRPYISNVPTEPMHRVFPRCNSDGHWRHYSLKSYEELMRANGLGSGDMVLEGFVFKALKPQPH